MKAGTLEIQLIADVAKLQQDMRAMERAVSSSNDNIVRTTNKGGGAFGGFSKSVSGAAEKSKLAGYQMQNLSYQIQDVIVGLSSGQKPMTVFTQQGSQIAQIMTQAGVGVGGLVKQVSSASAAFLVAHPLLLATAAAASVLAGGVALVSSEINKNSDVTVTWQDTMLGAFDVIKAEASEKVTAAFDAMGVKIGDVWDWIVAATKTAANVMIGIVGVLPRTIAATYDKIGPAIGDAFYSGANLAIKALNMLAQASTAPLNFIIDGMNTAFGTTIPHLVVGSIPAIENPYAGAMAKLGSAGATALTESFSKDYIGEIAGALSEAAQKRARAREAAEKAGKDLGKAAGAAAGKEAAKEIKMSFADAFGDVADYAKQIQAAMGDMQGIDKRLKDLAQEEKLLGLTGKAREDMLRQLQRDAELSEVQIKLDEAKRAGKGALADVYRDIIDRLHQVYAAEDAITGQNNWAEDLADSVARSNQRLSEMASLLTRIGGAGGILGSLVAIAGGDFNGVASGPVGDVLAYVLSEETGKVITKGGREVAEVLGDRLQDIFGKNGLFSQTLGETLAGAGLGYAASSAVGMKGSGSGIGSSIGGILGQAVGSKVFSFLGSAAGPVGTIVGGLLGGLVGGLFNGGAKYGNYSSVSGIGGNNSDARGAADQLGQSLQTGLQSIADALGVSLGAYQTSIGVTDGKYRISTTGRSGELKSKYSDVQVFGTGDAAAAAAVKAAIADAIRDGALAGLSEMDKALLMKGPDIEAQLQKVLAFEGVFKELKASSSPFADELRAMSDQFDRLRAIFVEAGATAEQYAQLQDLIAIKQRALIDQVSASYRSNFYTDAQNVAYAKQTISDTLTPFGKGNVQTVAAYTRLVEATNPLTDPELYGALMGVADAFAVIKDAAEAAKQAKAAEAAQKQAQKEQALADARNAVAQAYSRESGALEQTVDRLARLSETLHDLRDSIYDTDASTVSLATQLARLRKVGGLAAMGDESAAGQLGGVVRDYLSAAKATSATLADFQFAQATAAKYVDSAIGAADAGKSVAQQQLDELKAQAVSLGVIEDHVVTMAEAVQELNRLLAGGGSSSSGSSTGGGGAAVSAMRAQAEVDRIGRRIEQTQRMLDSSKSDLAIARMTEKLEKLEAAMVAATLAQKKSADILDEWNRGGRLATVSES